MKTKGNLPITLLQNKKTLAIIEAYFEINHLKQLYRQGWLNKGISANKCESVAEHSFAVALLALFLVDEHQQKIDTSKVLRMALIHDLGEVYAGDFTPSDGIEPNHKYQLEKQALIQIFSKLNNGNTWIELWEEYERGETPESKFVRQLDQLEMLLQASVYEHQGLANLSEFFASTQNKLDAPEIKSIFQVLETLR